MPTRRRARPASRSGNPRSRPSGGRTTARASKGLSARTFSGLNQKRMKTKSSGNMGLRFILNQGQTRPVQMLQTPKNFMEFDQHQWREGGTWYYVPCVADERGKGCPICDGEDEVAAKIHYKFLANIYDHLDKKVLVLEGPKTLATQIFYRYKRKPESFLKRVFDITKYPTEPVTYGFELAEERPTRTTGLKLHDLNEYIQREVERYFGNEGTSSNKKGRGKSALDDDDEFDDEDEFEDDEELEDDEFEDEDEDAEDEDEEEEEPDESEMMDKGAWSWSELQEYGRDLGLRKTYTKRSELVRAITKKRGY